MQREVGGNLAEILDTISYTIRERVRIKGEIRVLTSQVCIRAVSRHDAVICGWYSLPAKSFVHGRILETESFPCGYIALGLAGFLIIAGYFTINKLGEIEI